LICQDQLLKLVKIILTVKLFFVSVDNFKIETFESRLGQAKIFIKIVKIYWDCQDFWDLTRLFEIYPDILTLSRLFEGLQALKSRQIEKSWSWKVIKLTNSWSRSRQTVKICQKVQVLTDFSISIETFGTGKWCRDKIEISQLLRPTFCRCQNFLDCGDFLNCWDLPFRDHVKTNRDTQPYTFYIFMNSIHC
jgi:hypothetical protein